MGYAHIPRTLGKPSRLATFSKNALIVLNTIFIVFGFILFVYGCGGKTSTNRESYVAITENGGDIFQVTSNVLIILGIMLLIIGLWGLFGFHTITKATIYVSLLMLLAIMDITLGLYSSRIEAHAKEKVETNLVNTLQQLKLNQDPHDPTIIPILNSWDALQTELKCCGVHEYRDWFYTSPIAHKRIDLTGDEGGAGTERSNFQGAEDLMSIPHSCFKDGDDGMEGADFNTPISTESIVENVYGDGCLRRTVEDLDIDRLQRVGILMAVSKILAVICAMILTYQLRMDKILLQSYV